MRFALIPTVRAVSLLLSRFLRAGLCLVLVALVSACASHSGYRTSRYHRPPGPPDDPWGPYIREASLRFQVPDSWIRAVMRQEFGGRQYGTDGGLTTSSAGAVGLMQVMPETYEGLRARYTLGDDPYDPHNNILAGSAYIREMYDRYGSPGFLAAYNAGPNRLDRYLFGSTQLPDETVNYVASIAPRLGNTVAMSGPLSVYADPGAGRDFAPVQAASLPAPGAARADPPPRALDQSGPAVIAMAPIASPGDEGYAPSPETAAYRPAPLSRPSPPAPGFRFVASAPPVAPFHPAGSPGGWAIQVGAYADPGQARIAADLARVQTGVLTLPAQSTVGQTTRPDGSVLYRARVTGLSGASAEDACRRLRANGRDCILVPPQGIS